MYNMDIHFQDYGSFHTTNIVEGGVKARVVGRGLYTNPDVFPHHPPILLAPSSHSHVENGVVCGCNKLEHVSEEEDTQIHPESECPDGGWGWMVAAGGFVITFLAITPSTSFGILFSSYLLDLGTSATMTAWIFNLALTNAGLFCYLLGPLVEEFGWRSVTFINSFFFALGIILSAYAPSGWYMLITFSLILGPTIDISAFMAMVVGPYYFSKRRNLANAIMICGGSVSQMVMPLIITYLQEEYGIKGATLITGALALNGCVAAMVFHPVEWHTKKYKNIPTTRIQCTTKTKEPLNLCKITKAVLKKALQNMKYLKSVSVVTISVIIGLMFVAALNIFSLIPFVMLEAGYSQRDCSMCLMVAGILNFTSRLLTAALGCCKGVTARHAFLLGLFLNATAAIGLGVNEELVTYMIASGVCGLGYGLTAATFNLYAMEEFGLDKLNEVLGLVGLMTGILCLIIGPLTGVLHDVSHSYTWSLYLCGAGLGLSVLLGLAMPLIKNYEQGCQIMYARL